MKVAERDLKGKGTLTEELPKGWKKVLAVKDGWPIYNFGIRWNEGNAIDAEGLYVVTYGPSLKYPDGPFGKSVIDDPKKYVCYAS
jgi:hypothetical protein